MLDEYPQKVGDAAQKKPPKQQTVISKHMVGM
jgi:hypothetical protein